MRLCGILLCSLCKDTAAGQPEPEPQAPSVVSVVTASRAQDPRRGTILGVERDLQWTYRICMASQTDKTIATW